MTKIFLKRQVDTRVLRFKGAYIDSGAVDFSDKLRTSRRKGLLRLEWRARLL